MLDSTKPSNSWQKAVSKFHRSISAKNGLLVDCVKVRITKNSYLQEIAQGKQIHVTTEYPMLCMTPDQLKEHQLTYEPSRGILLDHNKNYATTIGKESKGAKNLQAFIMSKDGSLYIATHTGALNKLGPSLSHASFLGGRPAEMAGMISINSQGKIDLITDDSGHYAPKALDMYRGIKKLQSLMPNVFAIDAKIRGKWDHLKDLENPSSAPSIVVIKEFQNPKSVNKVSEFIEVMEKIGTNGKPLHEELRAQRVVQTKEYAEILKNAKLLKNNKLIVHSVENDIKNFNNNSSSSSIAVISEPKKSQRHGISRI